MTSLLASVMIAAPTLFLAASLAGCSKADKELRERSDAQAERGLVAREFAGVKGMAGPVEIEFEPSVEQRAKIGSLIGGAQGGHFETRELTPKLASLNGSLFVTIAAEHPAEPELARAALRAMGDAWSPQPKAQRDLERVVDADYVEVVTAYMSHRNKDVVLAALGAAQWALRVDAPDDELIRAIVIVGRRDDPDATAACYEVLETLSMTTRWRSNHAITSLYLDVLDGPGNGDKETWLVTQALSRINMLPIDFSDGAELRQRVEALLGHEDPSVRGLAAQIYAWQAATDEHKWATIEALRPMLNDEDAFVRSAVAGGLGYLGMKEVIPDIAGLLDDDADNTYTSGEWTRLSGGEGRYVLNISTWPTVSAAALEALVYASRSLGLEARYKPGLVESAEALEREVAGAKQWVAQREAENEG